MNPMSTAPRDGTKILVWARWDWYARDLQKGSHKAFPLVAYWQPDEWDQDEPGQWYSYTYNPYHDEAYEWAAIGWLPIPGDLEVEFTV